MAFWTWILKHCWSLRRKWRGMFFSKITNEMFYYKITNEICEGTPYMEEDASILFKYSKETDLSLDYTISLSGNPRYLMDVSCKTGICGPLRCFMAGAEIIPQNLKIPSSKRGHLYFKSKEEMTPYSGTMYTVFCDKCYYDEKKQILCLGSPECKGESVEFVEDTYAVIENYNLRAVFMKVKYLKKYIPIKKRKVKR